MKNLAIEYLKELNKGKSSDEIITRLYYGENGYVQDLSFFANLDYMSQDLLIAIQNGQTLTSGQEKELQKFIIEKRLEDTTVDMSKYKWNLAEETTGINEIVDGLWSKLKESIEQEKISSNHFITINTASTATFDVAKFTEQIAKSLKRQRGVY